MAKVSNREDALLNAYLNRYKNAQASTVNEGRTKHRRRGQRARRC